MDFLKINFDEMGWFCKSTRSPASDGYDRRGMLDCFMSILRFYGVRSFSAQDIACLFRLMEMRRSWRTDKLMQPTLFQTERMLGKRFAYNHVHCSDGVYTITSAPEDVYADWYPKALKDAYAKGNIKDWVEYAIERGCICNATLPEKLAQAQQAVR